MDDKESPIKDANELKMVNEQRVCDEVYEFCDVCDMELINHPDEEACPPHPGYVKVFQVCPVCQCQSPTREHVALHFIHELIEVVSQVQLGLPAIFGGSFSLWTLGREFLGFPLEIQIGVSFWPDFIGKIITDS